MYFKDYDFQQTINNNFVEFLIDLHINIKNLYFNGY